MEEWRQIPGFPGYKASSAGRILGRRGRVLSGCINNRSGYRVVCIMVGDTSATISVHHLVCTAFHGSRPVDHEVAHTDGCKTNNAANNLRWATSKENHADAIRHGTHSSFFVKGERNGHAKLTSDDVREIRGTLRVGSVLAQSRLLATKYGVSPYTIKAVICGSRWAHI